MTRDDVYTSLGNVEHEIKRRHEDIDLKNKLESFWGENKPNFINENGPRSVISKSIITPNLEFKYFLDISKEIGLETSLWEYHNGKFVGKNNEKKHLGKLFFYHGHGKNNGDKISHLNVVDFTKEEGKRMNEVRIISEKKLLNFHHELLNRYFPNENFKPKDISDWFDKTRFLDAYYLYYLSLFIRDHVLFENFFFDGEKEECKFTFDNFLPSFKKATEIFGCKPLIVPLLPHEHEKNHLWLYYDERAEGIVKEIL